MPLAASVLIVAGCGDKQSEQPPEDSLYIEAQKAVATGNFPGALELLNQSLAARPTSYGYFARSKLQSDMGNEDEAVADCEKGLEIDPEDGDLLWLQGELKKPAAQRFKGENELPPSASK